MNVVRYAVTKGRGHSIIPEEMERIWDAADESFGVTVRLRRARWSPDYLHRVGGEHRVEGARECGVAVTDDELARADPIAEIYHQVAGLLRRPFRGRVSGDAEDVDSPARDFHHEQHVQAAQRDRVDVEEVGREQPGRLGAQEGPPTGVDLARCWRDPGSGEDAADGAGAGLVAKDATGKTAFMSAPPAMWNSPPAGHDHGERRQLPGHRDRDQLSVYG